MSPRLRHVLAATATALSLAASYGCAAALAEPTPVDASFAAKRWPGTTLAELKQGRSLFVETCAGCHSLKDPTSHTPSEWKTEVEQMRGKKGVALDDRQAQLIIRYLSTMSSRRAEVAER